MAQADDVDNENQSQQNNGFKVTVISPRGDLILSIFDHSSQQSHRFRVDIQCLRQASPYFDHLLDPHAFQEGSRVFEHISRLRKSYKTGDAIPVTELPVVSVSDVGKISKVNSIQLLAADFLQVIHGQDLVNPRPPVPNLANLAIVADRFDALPILARYVNRKKIFQALDGKTNRGAGAHISEERMRQKLLVGLLLDHGPWVVLYTKRLIVKNSERWKSNFRDSDDVALYWDMPHGLEDEMMQRREYVLDTIQSVQTHFLTLYTHGERQCRLGYDTSPQCDSFQLGQMVRFFHRLDTFPLHGSIYAAEPAAQYEGDLERLIDSMRQCPEYQIDGNHRHCGMRERLLPVLDLLRHHLSMENSQIDIGVCADCWRVRRANYAWSEAKRPVSWDRWLATRTSLSVSWTDPGESVCLRKHIAVRNIFMAATREWTSREP